MKSNSIKPRKLRSRFDRFLHSKYRYSRSCKLMDGFSTLRDEISTFREIVLKKECGCGRMEIKDLKMRPSQRGVTMLLLTSNGLSSQALLNCVQSNMNSGKSAVIITTASVPFKRNDKHVPRLTAELESIGYSVDFFDFDEEDRKSFCNMIW